MTEKVDQLDKFAAFFHYSNPEMFAKMKNDKSSEFLQQVVEKVHLEERKIFKELKYCSSGFVIGQANLISDAYYPIKLEADESEVVLAYLSK